MSASANSLLSFCLPPTLSGQKKFDFFTILLNEGTSYCSNERDFACSAVPSTEDIIVKLGKLLKEKIEAHSDQKVDLLTGDDVIANNTPALVSVMFRLRAEDFVRNSVTTFKLIECRNSTKLSSDWKPSLADIIVSLGHQVILVDLIDFPHYTDFAYSILRQINYQWKIRLPRSFFYPDDVCRIDYSEDQQVVVVTPLLPDGDIDLASRVQDNLKYEILRMMKDSCANGLKNHLLKRDLRVGKFSDTEIGVNSIRHIYRTLQRRLNQQGSNIQMGSNNDDLHQFLLSVAGDSLMAAESHIQHCKASIHSDAKDLSRDLEAHDVNSNPGILGKNVKNETEETIMMDKQSLGFDPNSTSKVNDTRFEISQNNDKVDIDILEEIIKSVQKLDLNP